MIVDKLKNHMFCFITYTLMFMVLIPSFLFFAGAVVLPPAEEDPRTQDLDPDKLDVDVLTYVRIARKIIWVCNNTLYR
jgi:hypothetical protein